jgi:hypothetical protein
MEHSGKFSLLTRISEIIFKVALPVWIGANCLVIVNAGCRRVRIVWLNGTLSMIGNVSGVCDFGRMSESLSDSL